MIRNRTLSLGLAIAALAVAGAASAQTAPQTLIPQGVAAASASKIAWDARPALDLSSAHASFASPYAQPAAARPAGTVQTAVDYRFSSDQIGSVGYLCGLQPGPNESGGPASAFEPEGTFLGGQLRMAFK
jgi:hypothetical protein